MLVRRLEGEPAGLPVAEAAARRWIRCTACIAVTRLPCSPVYPRAQRAAHLNGGGFCPGELTR